MDDRAEGVGRRLRDGLAGGHGVADFYERDGQAGGALFQREDECARFDDARTERRWAVVLLDTWRPSRMG